MSVTPLDKLILNAAKGAAKGALSGIVTGHAKDKQQTEEMKNKLNQGFKETTTINDKVHVPLEDVQKNFKKVLHQEKRKWDKGINFGVFKAYLDNDVLTAAMAHTQIFLSIYQPILFFGPFIVSPVKLVVSAVQGVLGLAFGILFGIFHQILYILNISEKVREILLKPWNHFIMGSIGFMYALLNIITLGLFSFHITHDR